MGLEHSLPGWKTHSSAPDCLPVSLHVLPLTKGDLASFRKKTRWTEKSLGSLAYSPVDHPPPARLLGPAVPGIMS